MKLPVTPKKSLGQNFLNSERVLTKIVDATDPTGNDIVLEIGPGLGALTEKLLVFSGKVIAVEKDDTLYEILDEKFKKEAQDGKLDLIHKDIQDFDPNVLKFYKDSEYKIAANIPYNLTGLIIRKFLTADYQPSKMVLLIQKEVADRILARDGKESLLSISVKVYGKPRLITKVARGNFNPVPRVDSAVIEISNISRDHFPNRGFEDLFFQIIHAGFGHKRKVLIKNLLDAGFGDRTLWEAQFSKQKLSLTVRAEELSVADWVFLTQGVYF